MTDFHPTRTQNIFGSATRFFGGLFPLLMSGLALQGCAVKTVPSARIYAADVQGGAKQCDAPKPTPSAGQTTDVAIKLGNDGGWCGISVSQMGPGLLTTRPACHGAGPSGR